MVAHWMKASRERYWSVRWHSIKMSVEGALHARPVALGLVGWADTSSTDWGAMRVGVVVVVGGGVLTSFTEVTPWARNYVQYTPLCLSIFIQGHLT